MSLTVLHCPECQRERYIVTDRRGVIEREETCCRCNERQEKEMKETGWLVMHREGKVAAVISVKALETLKDSTNVENKNPKGEDNGNV